MLLTFIWLVVWNMALIFHNIWDNPSYGWTHIFQDVSNHQPVIDLLTQPSIHAVNHRFPRHPAVSQLIAAALAPDGPAAGGLLEELRELGRWRSGWYGDWWWWWWMGQRFFRLSPEDGGKHSMILFGLNTIRLVMQDFAGPSTVTMMH